MSILLKMGVTAWAALLLAALIVIMFVVAAIKKFFPEKPRKPWKRV